MDNAADKQKENGYRNTTTEFSPRILLYILILGLAAYTVKNLFVGSDVDESYGIMAGYRLAKGDRLLLEMWEPHQSSAIFTALLIRFFLWFTGGNNDFLNLYLKSFFFLGQGMIAFYAYRTFCVCNLKLSKKESILLAMFFYVISPKSIFVPEYSNLHMWFLALLCLNLMRYYCTDSKVRGRKRFLIASGVFMACDVLAYPSMVLLFPVCMVFILRKSVRTAWKEVALFSVPCVFGALIFTGYILSYMTFSQIVQVLPHILGEGSHQTTFADKLSVWLENFGAMFAILAVSAAVAFVITIGYGRFIRHKEQGGDRRVCFLISFLGAVLSYQYFCWFTSIYNASYPQLLHVAIPLTGIYGYCKTQKANKAGFYLILFSFVSYFAVLLLSNWGPLLLNPYLFMGTIGGMLCLGDYLKRYAGKIGSRLLQLICSVLILSNVFGYCYLIIGGDQAHTNIFAVRGISHEGIRKGIFDSYMTAYRYNQDCEDWREAVPDGSVVLYLGLGQFHYMMGECTVAAPNTISTPVYDESILEYWRLNPERYPDIVVIESWFGENRLYGQDSFIMQWLANDFQPSEVAVYPYLMVYYR